jgi:hypothetical protein
MPPTFKLDDQQRANNFIGVSLLIAAGALFAAAIILLLTTTSPYTILFGVLSLAVGLAGFKQFEFSTKEISMLPVFELDLLGAVLKTGIGFHVLIELTFSPAPFAPAPFLERIKVRLQRTLNIYGSRLNKLPDDPFTEVEHILTMTADPLSQELGIDTISIKVIDVKLEGSPEPPKRGIHFGA